MNDWWNDPPEDVEARDITPEQAAYFDNFNQLDPWDQEAWKQSLPEKCPHGNKWGECDRCDFEGDLAYDARRGS